MKVKIIFNINLSQSVLHRATHFARWVSKENRYGKGILEKHRLVAETFIPNKANQPFVRHKDGKLTNNHFSNLSWCSRLSVYSASRKKSKALNSKAIVMNNGTTTRCYLSIKNAERRTGISASNICQVLRGKRKTAGGYSWSYKQ